MSVLTKNYRIISHYESKIKYILLVALPALIYFSSLSYGFIWDDHTYIVNNQVLDARDGILKIWTTRANVDFWPFSYSFFWLQKQFFGVQAFGYHFVNLLVFIFSILLVFKLLKKLNIKSAFLISLIYAIHPINVEDVVWVFQAKTNLANIFGLLSCIYFINFYNKEKLADYLFAFLFVALSFLSKISLVMLPVVFLLYLFIENRYDLKKKIIVTLPFFLLAFVIGLINVYWDSRAFEMPASEIILEPNLLLRFALIGKTFLFYLFKTFWPWPLMFVHPRWVLELNNVTTFIPTLIVVCVLIFTVYKIFKKEKVNIFLSGFLISFLIMLPALGLVEIYFMRFSYVAEHWLTVGMLGFLVPIIEYIYQKNYFKYAVWVFVLCLSVMTANYVQEYSSEKLLLESSLKKNPNSILPHNILGLIYKNENNLEQALVHFQKSIEIQPNAQSYYNMASIYEILKQYDSAKTYYLKSIELNPFIPIGYNSLGALYGSLKDYSNAIGYFMKAIERDPGNSMTYYNVGLTYEYLDQKKEALEWYTKAKNLAPDNPLYLNAVQRLIQ